MHTLTRFLDHLCMCNQPGTFLDSPLMLWIASTLWSYSSQRVDYTTNKWMLTFMTRSWRISRQLASPIWLCFGSLVWRPIDMAWRRHIKVWFCLVIGDECSNWYCLKSLGRQLTRAYNQLQSVILADLIVGIYETQPWTCFLRTTW